MDELQVHVMNMLVPNAEKLSLEDGKYLTLGEDPRSFYFYPLKQRQSLEMTLVLAHAR